MTTAPFFHKSGHFQPSKKKICVTKFSFQTGLLAAATICIFYGSVLADLFRQWKAGPDLGFFPKDARVAICLVGGARNLELTGPTLKKYVFDEYKGADIFVHVPFDNDTYKLSVLDGNYSFASIRIVQQPHVNVTSMYRKLLRAGGSPQGVQGLLEYFNLVEGCWQLIEHYQIQQNVSYDVIIRTRLDTFWNAPLQTVTSFKKGYYTIPLSSAFGGLNDRMGVGDYQTSKEALQRLSILPFLFAKGYKRLNSERLFLQQIRFSHMHIKTESFAFCVLSHRKFSWEENVPLISIASKGALNGAYCRPCTPNITGNDANKMLSSLGADGWTPNLEDNIGICYGGNTDWEGNWEAIFDDVSVHNSRETREVIRAQSRSECMIHLDNFYKKWNSWYGHSVQDICILKTI